MSYLCLSLYQIACILQLRLKRDPSLHPEHTSISTPRASLNELILISGVLPKLTRYTLARMVTFRGEFHFSTYQSTQGPLVRLRWTVSLQAISLRLCQPLLPPRACLILILPIHGSTNEVDSSIALNLRWIASRSGLAQRRLKGPWRSGVEVGLEVMQPVSSR